MTTLIMPAKETNTDEVQTNLKAILCNSSSTSIVMDNNSKRTQYTAMLHS